MTPASLRSVFSGRYGDEIVADASVSVLLCLATSLSFIGYGLAGVVTTADWLPIYAALRLPEWVAWPAMPILGTVDIAIGLALAFHPCRAFLSWAILWAGITTLLYPLAGLGGWILLRRSLLIASPLALLLTKPAQSLPWFDELLPGAILHEYAQRAARLLHVALALSLLGIAGQTAFGPLPAMLQPLAVVNLDSPLALRCLGILNGALAVVLLLKISRALLLAISGWYLFTNSLSILAHGFGGISSILQNAPEILAPLSLLALLHILDTEESSEPPAHPAGGGIGEAMRILFSSLVFAAALSTAYAWMRIDRREHERAYPNFENLVDQGDPNSSWLPPNLPASARHIFEAHDLTSKVGLATFHVSDPMEFQKYVAHLHATDSGKHPCEPPASLIKPEPHWSSDLDRYRQRYSMVVTNDNRAYAYEPDTGQIYSWRCPP